MGESGMTGERVFFQRIADFSSSRELSDEDFAVKFGRGFFLHFGDLGAMPTITALGKTAFAAPPEFTNRPPRGAEFIVFPIRLSGRTPFTDFVSIGRADNNDIVVHDGSVSGLQAIVRIERTPEGRMTFLLQDAGSKNGTYVGEQRVPGPDSNQFSSLAESGTAVQIGNVALTFMLVSEFRKLLAGIKR